MTKYKSAYDLKRNKLPANHPALALSHLYIGDMLTRNMGNPKEGRATYVWDGHSKISNSSSIFLIKNI